MAEWQMMWDIVDSFALSALNSVCGSYTGYQAVQVNFEFVILKIFLHVTLFCAIKIHLISLYYALLNN